MLSKRQLCSPLVAGILLVLPLVTIVADGLLQKLGDEGAPMAARALFDSVVHVALGCLAWAAVTVHRNFGRRFWWELSMAAAFSAGVDVDHFIAARSFALKDALHMPTPPPFHDISLSFLFFLVSLLQYCTNRGKRWQLRYHLLQMSTMLAVHLCRDAARRGLHVAYLVTIPPGEPFGLFPFFLPFFPLLTRAVLMLAETESSLGSWRTGDDECRAAGEDRKNSSVNPKISDCDAHLDDLSYQAMFY
ncbi:hypothetical protein BV898_15178 [Hypsibius exemplaris]|uniref:Transmembrane protein 267 n=1 Tax=Hypsibius exemplaris TaxID=2072580 RepID=A0A9X6NCH3_HYPEX|nr:hypothetical protein BV898_15178 [Hypsibius exemplaris]